MFNLGKPERRKLGEYLRQKRLEKNISQTEIAKKLKLTSGQMISNIERGLCSVPLYQIQLMSRIYDINDHEILTFILELQESSLRKAMNIKETA